MTTAGVRRLHPDESPSPGIDVTDERLVIRELIVDDPEVTRLVATAPHDDRDQLVRRILSVGARGLTTMGIGAGLADVDTRVAAIVKRATEEAEQTVVDVLDRARSALGDQLDPDQRSSLLSRALGEFTGWRDAFLRDLDPAVEDSTATELVARLRDLVGPGGTLDRRLGEALDVDTDGSSLNRLAATISTGFDEMRRDLARAQGAEEGRAAEAERGTAHGLDFEDVVDAILRDWASHIKGATVERTGTVAGSLAAGSRVGDFVVTLPSGDRIVVEAKRHSTIALTGSDGILAELDRAMANRKADAAICIAGRESFPAEVGTFNVYGNRVLTVDEGDGAMSAVALQWATAALARRSDGVAELDGPAVVDRIDRIRKAAESLSGARRAVTNIRVSLDKLHDTLGDLRSEMLDHVGDLDRLLGAAESLGTQISRT